MRADKYSDGVRRTTLLASGSGFAVSEIRISARTGTWLCPERPERYRLVFVRSGCYRMRAPSLDAFVDPVNAYITRPGHEHQIAHKPDVEDVCTELLLSESFLEEAVGTAPPSGNRLLFTKGPIDLAHRALAARSKRGADLFEIEERVLRLVGDTLSVPRNEAAGRSATASTTRRRVVERTRELLIDGPTAMGLTRLAREVGVSPHYLSRIFRQETGETLSRFRNRIRIRRALDRIEAGEGDLTQLATDLGFSDHAHFTRTMRGEVGIPPRSVRRELAA